ncbi:hypothetical protein Tco_0815842 [Tanacetum coccineum]
MHTSRDDYLINTLRFVSVKEETQIYGAILLESLTSPEMKETKSYKTYFGFATGATPPKKPRSSRRHFHPKLTIVLVLNKEPTGKSKRVKRLAKKSTKAPARGVVIRETPKIPFSKKKEKPRSPSHHRSSYDAAAMLIEFELKKILINKIDKSESYLEALEHRECYDGLIKYYDLDKTIFFTYSKVGRLARMQTDERSKKLMTQQSGSSKGTKSQSKSSGKSVQSKEPEFEVADSNMPQDQEENLGNDDVEPKEKVASKRDWFTKPTQPQEPTDPV